MKTKALLTCLFCCCMAPASLSAQAFTQIYRPLGLSNELAFYRIAPALDGGFFVAGQLETVSQIVVARLDAQGKPFWKPMLQLRIRLMKNLCRPASTSTPWN
jgi:hypothetical protein